MLPIGRFFLHPVALGLFVLAGCAPSADRTDAAVSDTVAGPPPLNFDEWRVPDYALPDPLVTLEGDTVRDAREWRTVRRPEIVALFEEHVFGRPPAGPLATSAEVLSVDDGALGGRATRKEVRLQLTGDPEGPGTTILLYLPSDVPRPVPVFLAYNDYGNHTVHRDPGISLSPRWVREHDGPATIAQPSTEASRGLRSWEWPVDRILERGYGLATLYYEDVDPDFDDGFDNGIHPWIQESGENPGAWASMGAWAWGLGRAMDYLVADPDVDPEGVVVLGHRRLGIASLWAGARDERFAIVITSDSGAGGAALSRRQLGETLASLHEANPHWFTHGFDRYAADVASLPVDQHMLLALVAPRPLYVASAIEDRAADPRGEFLSAWHTGPVYALLGFEALPVDDWPAVDSPVWGRVGYHVRSGGGDITDYDWERFMDFADAHLGG